MNPVLYVILNGSLNMSPGKAAAQTAHAVMTLQSKHREEFMLNYRRTVIVLSASGREQMDGIVDYLSDAGVDFEYYIDEGMNEVEAFSMTAIAVEPLDAEDKRRDIFESLYLYRGSETQIKLLQDARIKDSQEINRLRNIIDEPKWYERLFKRKKEGFIS